MRRRIGLLNPAAVSVLTLAVLLSACGRPMEDASWFPLQDGRQWTYRVTTELQGNIKLQEEVQVQGMGRADLDGQPTWLRRDSSGDSVWLRRDDSGIYRVASSGGLDPEPEIDPSPGYLLKAPYVAGTRWHAPASVAFVRRQDDALRAEERIPMFYVIEDVQQRVQTPAGRFDGCLRVSGKASIAVRRGMEGGMEVPLVTMQWYCPGVGLARLEELDEGGPRRPGIGRVTVELAAWK